MQSWIKDIDPLLQKHLAAVIKEASKDKKAILNSKDPKTAQLWVAVANLAQQNFDLNQRVKLLEGALKQSLGGKTKTTSTQEKEEIDKIMKSLRRL